VRIEEEIDQCDRLYAGIVEEFKLYLQCGSIPLAGGSILRARFPDAVENSVEFLVGLL
jgi:hypothetical protein